MLKPFPATPLESVDTSKGAPKFVAVAVTIQAANTRANTPTA